MQTGRSYSAKFADDASRSTYYTWSAGQMMTYNAKVTEQQYFDAFARKFWCPVEKPAADQKYAHLVSKKSVPWLSSVPSAILGIGAYLFYQGTQRWYRGLAAKPKIRKIKGAARSLWLTRDYFSISKLGHGKWLLKFGSKTKQGGSIVFRAHRSFQMPAQVHITCRRASLTVGFSFDDGRFEETTEETVERLSQLTREELQACAIGCDRGCVIGLQTSEEESVSDDPRDSGSYSLSSIQKERIDRKEVRRKRYMRKLARQKEGNRNAEKTKKTVAETYVYERHVRNDFAHQTSRRIVDKPEVQLIVLEALKTKNMTARPQPKYDDNGKPLPNGASAKAGLNKSILGKAWGKTGEYLKYKAKAAGKLVVEVPAQYSSQTCSRCGCVDKANRRTQAVFGCVRCGHTENADRNAAKVIRDRGVDLIVSGQWMPAKKKKLLRVPRAKQLTADVRAGRPEMMPAERSAPTDSCR